MNEPKFLTVGQIENLHKRGLERWGGSEGLRNRALFEGAVAQAQNVYWYGQDGLILLQPIVSTSLKLKPSSMEINELL